MAATEYFWGMFAEFQEDEEVNRVLKEIRNIQ